ncbi:MAG: 1-deoxy-D-xylulose-5-phosphate synthase [Phycisphaeraceae bacterium]|nr:1-deoxy-D-xylulose-5-phosphate synthase [Phycisphaeraceae bacterium]
MTPNRLSDSEPDPRPLLAHIRSPQDLKRLSIEQLPDLAAEIREAICRQVSLSGGHLAPNLGVVELTIALHYVFDFATDRLLFDVGHQCYPHKLLTGRQDLLPKLRQAGGMAGFPEPRESPYDLFSVGHAGTAISTAVGMARADQLLGRVDRRVVSLVGDASIVNGVAMEGLNNAGTLKRQFLVVLNDNGMSIAKPQGGMAQFFDRIRVSPTYERFRRHALDILKRLPYGDVMEEAYHRGGEMMKAALLTGHMFEQFGFVCVGPVDGHDLPSLIDLLNEARDYDRPLLLHVKTIKGKGFDFSEGDATKFHSPKPFRVEGCRVEIKGSGRAFTTAFADAMIDIMDRDPKVFAVTAAMPDGTGVSKLLGKFPERSLDTGICESHAMDMCAGMAKSGIKPFFAVYSTFAQRALDQVFQEISLQGLPVRVCMDRAGFVGEDGAVHHGFMDIAMFRVFPNAVLMAAADEPNLKLALEFMRSHDAGPTFLRYPRENVPAKPVQQNPKPYELGKAALVRPAASRSCKLAVLAYGTQVYPAIEAVDRLGDSARDIAVYDARFAKPVDAELIAQLISARTWLLTIEDHLVTGGFGASVLEACNQRGLPTDRIVRLGMPERWFAADTRANQLAQAGLDPKGIERRLRDVIDLIDAESCEPAPVIHVTTST